MDKNLKNIVVAGASGTVGIEATKELLRQGYHVAAITRTPSGLEKLKNELHQAKLDAHKVLFLAGDLSDEKSVNESLDQVLKNLGSIDGVINTVGRFKYAFTKETSIEDYEMLMNANLKCPWLFAKYCLPKMVEQNLGRMIFISSESTLGKGEAGMGLYLASKAGLNMLIKSMGQEVKGKDISLNAILPTIIDTDENRKGMPSADFSTWVDPKRLASFAVKLLDPSCKDIKGAMISFPAGL